MSQSALNGIDKLEGSLLTGAGDLLLPRLIEQLLREIAKDSLEPLISGSRLDDHHSASREGRACVAFRDPCQIEFKADNTDLYRLTPRRSQPCLDASIARTGACIGIVTGGHTKDWRNVAVQADDHIGATKAKSLTGIVAGRGFQQLDRRLRQELVAIDGATLVDRTGALLAVGAILQILGGSTGGGHLGAAKALGALGVGIKVSQDGGITGYHGHYEPKFTVM